MRARTYSKIGAGLFALSAIAFLIEFFGEVTGIWLLGFDWFIHELTELATLCGFIIGGAFIFHSQRLLRRRNDEVEQLLRAAQGQFGAMVQAQFSSWGLSEAEQEIAYLTMKGFTVAEISDIRKTSQGTVKSQNNAIYRKAGVKSRTQLLGALIDELLIEPSTGSTPETAEKLS